MAHTCSTCGDKCHCCGDIDDLMFHDTPNEYGCICCDFDDTEEDENWCDDDVSDEEREDNRKAYIAEMNNWPQPTDISEASETDDLPF